MIVLYTYAFARMAACLRRLGRGDRAGALRDAEEIADLYYRAAEAPSLLHSGPFRDDSRWFGVIMDGAILAERRIDRSAAAAGACAVLGAPPTPASGLAVGALLSAGVPAPDRAREERLYVGVARLAEDGRRIPRSASMPSGRGGSSRSGIGASPAGRVADGPAGQPDGLAAAGDDRIARRGLRGGAGRCGTGAERESGGCGNDQGPRRGARRAAHLIGKPPTRPAAARRTGTATERGGGPAMIAVENLAFRAGAFRLDGVSFTVAAGEYAVLMGKTGAGKTTILEAVCGLRPARSRPRPPARPRRDPPQAGRPRRRLRPAGPGPVSDPDSARKPRLRPGGARLGAGGDRGPRRGTGRTAGRWAACSTAGRRG